MIPLGKNISSIFLWSILLLTCLGPAGAVSGQDLSSPAEKNLYFASWEGNFLSWHRQGVATWVHDAEGNLRFELMLGDDGVFPGNLYKILDWNGPQGWTVISVESGGGTFSRWNEQWQELPDALDTWLRVLVAESVGGLKLPSSVRDISPQGRSLCLPFFANAQNRVDVKRLQLPGLNDHDAAKLREEPTSFRQQQSWRGRGRGGREAVLSIAGPLPDGEGFRITSSHRPGSLHLFYPRTIKAEFQSEEVFLPWWPLSEILQLKI